jgi:hypothetical protein
MHEIYAPALGRAGRYGGWSTMQCDVFPSPHAHPELQAIESIEPPHPLAVHQPAFETSFCVLLVTETLTW